MKAIAVIGYHRTGKTTLVTTLIKELVNRGYSVVSLKDIHSEAYHADTEGKNTNLHLQAGSQAVFAKGLYDSALIFPKSLELKELIPLLKADYLIIEGMKQAPVPKLVCAENTTQLEELVDDTCFGVSGLISDKIANYKDLPVFCLQRDLDQLIATVIANSFDILPLSDPECCSACGKSCYQMAADIVQGKAQRSDCVLDNQAELQLSVNSEDIVIVPFVQKLLKDMVTSFVGNLKGIDPSGDIELKIKR